MNINSFNPHNNLILKFRKPKPKEDNYLACAYDFQAVELYDVNTYSSRNQLYGEQYARVRKFLNLAGIF